MIPLILAMGCLLFLCVGIGIASWGGMDIQTEGSDIKNVIMFLVGVGLTIFSLFSMDKASDYYHEKESPKTEITTSIPPQIDTIVTIKNSVSDTTYIYRFNLTEK